MVAPIGGCTYTRPRSILRDCRVWRHEERKEGGGREGGGREGGKEGGGGGVGLKEGRGRGGREGGS